jgi:hypothetical protein
MLRAFLIPSAFLLTLMACFAPAAETAQSTDTTYQLGNVVGFGTGGDSERYKVSGWSKAEKEFTWTQGKGATLSVEIPAVDSELNLRIKLVGLINPPDVTYQPVEVYVNTKKIADWQVAAPESFMAIIPKEIVAAKKLDIELRTPKSTTPKALKMNDDARVLGVACYEMQITKGE